MKFQTIKRTCIMAVVAACFMLPASHAQELTALRVDKAPAIDGKLDEKCWSWARAADKFKQLRTNEPAKYPSYAYVLYDNTNNLYIGFKCFEPEMKRLKKIIADNKNEFKYNQGENIEIFLQPDTKISDFIQFIVNTNGTRVHFGRSDLFSGKINWDAAVFTGKDFFSIEVRIPFASMHLAGCSKSWGINLCRARMPSEARSTPFSSWAPAASTFKNPQNFGKMLINNDFSRFFYIVKFSPGILEIKNLTGRPEEIITEVITEENGKREIQFKEVVNLAVNENKKFQFEYRDIKSLSSMNIVTLKDKKTGTILFQGASQSIDVTPNNKNGI